MLRLDDCDERAGRKAATLARLRAAGLPVLDGVALLPDEPVDDAALEAALSQLGGERFAVRSSSSIEDAPGVSGAGVFESVIGARGLDGVKAAIARVRASAGGEPARAYLAARGLPAAQMAVLIQPVVRADTLAVARSRDGGGFLVEERRAGEPEWGDVTARVVSSDAALEKIAALLGGPVDVELARSGEAVTFLQARPRATTPARHDFPVAGLGGGSWRLDAEHNPEPLSAAQAGLVARVDALGIGAEQRVVGGWLFVARGGSRKTTPVPLPELRKRFDGEIAPDCDARLRAVEDAPLAEVLDAYDHVWRRYVGEVGPTLKRAREQLDQLLRMNLGEGLAQNGALLAGLGGLTVERDQLLWKLGRGEASFADYCARFGALAPAWDVAVAPDDESEPRVRAVAARLAAAARSPDELHADALARADAAGHETLERLDRMARRAFKALLPLVRDALPVAEDDDLLFFRAQRAVRRALLRAAPSLGLTDPTLVFELPLDHGLANANDTANANRAARLAAARTVPPLAVDEGVARHPESATVLRGHATSGKARGRALVVRSPAAAPAALPDDAILVVPAILPSLAYLLPGARALVTDHGGATSHGATLAREYGIPAVLGTRSATTLPDGAELYVDADAGRVYLL
jgi:phosphohistidine swiveling domain-containing protein